jgi:hypothetical protein
MPDGMGGIDPIESEMTGTLMLRGAYGELLATGRRSQYCNSEVARLPLGWHFLLLHSTQGNPVTAQ